jgi:two-component system response regulator LytT
MRILIVEDEPPNAEYLERGIWEIMGSKIQNIHISLTREDAFEYLKNHPIDLCFLDLNLSGEDGYDILKRAVAMPFHTIIVSAYTERAIEAFEYGVIDFVPKPYNIERLRQAFDRYFGRAEVPGSVKYLVFRKLREHKLLAVEDIAFFKAVRYLVEAHLENGKAEYLDKPLNRLEQILPKNFVRIHRSYIVNLHFVEAFLHKDSSRYQVRLKGGELLPLSRNRSRNFKNLLDK